MKKAINIFGLALVLLFFAGCGKKEDNLPSESKSDKVAKALPSTEKSTKSESPAESDFQNKNLRPVIVTVLESGCFSPGAVARVEKTAGEHKLWRAKTDQNGVAKVLIPPNQTFFRVTAIKDSYAFASFYTNRLAPGITPVYVELSLEEPGVVITAKLIADKDIDEENVLAKIVTERRIDYRRCAVTSLHCEDNKVIFPPIRDGAKRLKVVVKAKGFAESYSEYFDTLNNEDKTVQVKLLSSVKFRGKAVRSDGVIITNFYVHALPRGLHEKGGMPGHVTKRIITDSEGNFEIDGLLPEHYKIVFSPIEALQISTNIFLSSDVENYMELVFPKFKYHNINGIVKYEHSGEPAAGIGVKYILRYNEVKELKTKTDSNGKFSFSVPVLSSINSTLIVNEPGYAKVKYNIYKYKGKIIAFLLRETGTLTGTIKTQTGKPVSGIKVKILSVHTSSSKRASNTASLERYPKREIIPACNAESKFSSDKHGTYVISNVAAPQSYTIKIDRWENKDYYSPYNYDNKIKIEPGETTVYDIAMFRKPVVLVQLKDREGNPILKYTLHKGNRSGGGNYVALSDDDDWYRIDICGSDAKGKITLIAETKNWQYAKKENIFIEPDKTNKIILTLSDVPPPDIAGFVYTSDMNPLVDGYISAKANGKYGDDQCDYLGYFKITGMELKKSDEIKLSAHYKEVNFYTNVFAGDDDFEWVLQKPKRIFGRVCIGDINTPATNYTFSIINKCSKTFYSQDGTFSLLIDNCIIKKDGKMKIVVPGYVTEYITFNYIDFKTSNPYDVGDIIIKNKPATITGRVIDQDYNPLSAFVSLMEIKDDSKPKNILNVRNDKTDGTFKFTGLPPGNYYIRANTRFNRAETESFELYSDESYSLPDLMINETNVAHVLFEFILPDGTKASNVKVDYFNKSTDEHGFLKAGIMHRTYRNWKVRIDEKLYSSGKIKIKDGTESITVKLVYLPSIRGTVKLDGQPLETGNLSFYNKDNSYRANISDGKFETEALPGKYTVNSNNGGMGIIELSESGPNEINLRNGTGRSRIKIIR